MSKKSEAQERYENYLGLGMTEEGARAMVEHWQSKQEATKTKFEYTDQDGDRLRVWGGGSGAVLNVHSDDGEEVVVNFETLPKLIAALQAILSTEQKG